MRRLSLVLLQALMEGSDWKDTPLLGRLEVLENLDNQSRVLRGTVAPNGAAHTVRMPAELSCPPQPPHFPTPIPTALVGLLQAKAKLG